MRQLIKDLARITPGLSRLVSEIRQRVTNAAFPGSARYWQHRYASGGNSGPGSYNNLAEFKAKELNKIVEEENLSTVIEWGCGDGNQLALAKYPKYLGLDVSDEAIRMCRASFQADETKHFKRTAEYAGEQAELALSLDVIYHLVEDKIFEEYMTRLFRSATRVVVIYSSDFDANRQDWPPHIRHRCFSRWVADNVRDWRLEKRIPNRFQYDGNANASSFADFFIYRKLHCRNG